MKANEFVKKYGLELSREIVSNQPKWASNVRVSEITGTWEYTEKVLPSFSIDDLKRLVESHELVGSVRVLGRTGYEEVKSHLNHCDPKWCHFHYKKWKQAIADVESCMGEG